MQQANIKDQILKSYIEQIFSKYDVDRSGTLDPTEMTAFFNDLFRSLNMGIVVNEMQAIEAIKSIDVNYDGKVDKGQLYNAFRIMINPQQNNQNTQNAYQQPYNQPNYQQQTPYTAQYNGMINNGSYQQYGQYGQYQQPVQSYQYHQQPNGQYNQQYGQYMTQSQGQYMGGYNQPQSYTYGQNGYQGQPQYRK